MDTAFRTISSDRTAVWDRYGVTLDRAVRAPEKAAEPKQCAVLSEVQPEVRASESRPKLWGFLQALGLTA